LRVVYEAETENQKTLAVYHDKLRKAITEGTKQPAPPAAPALGGKRKVEPGWEDLIVLVVIVLVVIGYAKGQLTIQDVLSYIGVSGAGGIWGMLGGSSSSKQ